MCIRDSTYIREHYQLRAILESACAGLAAEEGVDISGSRDSYEESKAALENGDYSQYASQNREFHSEIWAAAGNKKMENMIAEPVSYTHLNKCDDGKKTVDRCLQFFFYNEKKHFLKYVVI